MRRADVDELAKIEAQLEETETELKEVQRKLKPLKDKEEEGVQLTQGEQKAAGRPARRKKGIV